MVLQTGMILTVATALIVTAPSKPSRSRKPATASPARANGASQQIQPAPEPSSDATTPAPPARILGARTRIVVAGLDAPDLPEGLRRSLEEAIGLEVQRNSKAEVIAPHDLRAFFSLARRQQILGCDDSRCLAHLNDVLAAQQLVAGSVHRLGKAWLFSLRLTNLVEQRVINRSSEETLDTPRALLQTARRLIPPLFGVVGRITIWGQPEHAELFIDDRFVGLTPQQAVSVREPGEHRLSIAGAGITAWSTTVHVQPGEDVRVRAGNLSIAHLEEQALAQRARGWQWLGSGSVAAVMAAASWMLAYRNDRRLEHVDLRALEQSEIDAITSTTLNLTVLASALTAGALGFGVAGGHALLVNPAQDILDRDAALSEP